MSDTPTPHHRPRAGIDQISTRWALVQDPMKFALRYAPAIRGYLSVFLKNPHDVEDVCQSFLLRVVERGVVEERRLHGRFRDYLIAAVRNAALGHLRRRSGDAHAAMAGGDVLAGIAAPAIDDPGEQEWLARWRRAVLKNVWEALENHQAQHPGNLAHSVLRALVDHPEEDSSKLAARVGRSCGRVVRPEAFRKQVSRARRQFAELLVAEIAGTLDNPSPVDIEEELLAIGVMKHVRPYLPADWRTSGKLLDAE